MIARRGIASHFERRVSRLRKVKRFEGVEVENQRRQPRELNWHVDSTKANTGTTHYVAKSRLGNFIGLIATMREIVAQRPTSRGAAFQPGPRPAGSRGERCVNRRGRQITLRWA